MNLLEPFQFQMMREALLVGALVGAACAALSCFLVLKGWSLMGDAISHAVLPGVVVSYLLGIPMALGAFASGLLCAVSTGWIKANSRIKEDTVMGIMFTGLFALGLLLFTQVETDVHLTHILFGHILGIERPALIQTVVTASVALLILLALRRDLLLFCFDVNHARGIGLRTTLIYYLFLALLAATIVASLQAVGIILVVAMLVTPGCIGHLMADRFDRMLIIAIASAVFSACVGVYTSFFIDAEPGACIVLTQSALFVLAFIFAPKHGLLAAKRLRKKTARRELVADESPAQIP